jgi:hypothetical protein
MEGTGSSKVIQRIKLGCMQFKGKLQDAKDMLHEKQLFGTSSMAK